MLPMILYRFKGVFLKTGQTWDDQAFKKDKEDDFAEKNINKPPAKLEEKPKDRELAIKLTKDGDVINDRYRRETKNENLGDTAVSEMVSKNLTKRDLILYRGVNDEVYKQMVKNGRAISDCDFYEKGFLFTSLIKGGETNDPKKLRIFVEAGSRAYYLGAVNGEDYHEVVVMRGAKMKVISADSTYINCRLLSTYEEPHKQPETNL